MGKAKGSCLWTLLPPPRAGAWWGKHAEASDDGGELCLSDCACLLSQGGFGQQMLLSLPVLMEISQS